VALTDDPGRSGGSRGNAPIAVDTVAGLLMDRPELTLDGRRPSVDELTDRLASFWLPDEVVLYAGLAGRDLRRRVRDYYGTRLGANKPHAGGWPLKTLDCLGDLYVHYAYCGDVAAGEQACLARFASQVTAASRSRVHDPVNVMPFANLEFPPGVRKAHGIRGARAPRASARSPRRAGVTPPVSRPAQIGQLEQRLVTQRVTSADIQRGQIRIPRASKALFPTERTDLDVEILGGTLRCRWDPRPGPPERSGVLRIGRDAALELLRPEQILAVASASNGSIRIG